VTPFEDFEERFLADLASVSSILYVEVIQYGFVARDYLIFDQSYYAVCTRCCCFGSPWQTRCSPSRVSTCIDL